MFDQSRLYLAALDVAPITPGSIPFTFSRIASAMCSEFISTQRSRTTSGSSPFAIQLRSRIGAPLWHSSRALFVTSLNRGRYAVHAGAGASAVFDPIFAAMIVAAALFLQFQAGRRRRYLRLSKRVCNSRLSLPIQRAGKLFFNSDNCTAQFR